MRLLRRHIDVPVMTVSAAGLRIQRMPVDVWLCRHDDGTTTHLAPWPRIAATSRARCS